MRIRRRSSVAARVASRAPPKRRISPFCFAEAESRPGPRRAHQQGAGRRLSRDAGLRGLFFDVEQQTGDVWAFPRATDTHTFADYEAKALQRGIEFMAAIAAAAPETTILMNVATTEVFRAACIAGGAPR